MFAVFFTFVANVLGKVRNLTSSPRWKTLRLAIGAATGQAQGVSQRVKVKISKAASGLEKTCGLNQ
jgi:hypothetical protein